MRRTKPCVVRSTPASRARRSTARPSTGSIASRNKQLVAEGLNALSFRLGFRPVDGLAEREVYREFFPRGLTALDNLDAAGIGTHPGPDQVTARKEVLSLLSLLKLPVDERGRRRAANRAEWFRQVDKPLEIHDIFGAPAD